MEYWKEPFGEQEWIVVPSGEFWMGEAEEAHRVFLDQYWIARVPVTNAQYRLFVQDTRHWPPYVWENGRPPRGLESHPVVESVDWFDAIAYCRWLSAVAGKRITLPSEAEWEKAARGDKDKRAYPWGDKFDAQRCNSWELGLHRTTPVGMFPEGASPYGCLDMSGNVYEWTRSLWGEYPYPKDQKGRQARENIEAPKTEARVLRGGAFNLFGGAGSLVRCDRRHSRRPDYRYDLAGFRVAVSPSPPIRSVDARLRYEGVYRGSSGVSSGGKVIWPYLRFYPDGWVISASVASQPEHPGKWFSRENADLPHGKVTIQGNHLSFSAVSASGAVDYTGEIDGDQIRLDIYSHINQHRRSDVYGFVRW